MDALRTLWYILYTSGKEDISHMSLFHRIVRKLLGFD